MFGTDCTQMGNCSPIHTHLLLTCCFGLIYLGPMGWGLLPAFGRTLSASVLFSILMKAGMGISFPFRGIGHDDLATNKFVEAGAMLGHGISSVVGGMEAEVVAGALGCTGIGCGSIGGLFGLGINGTSPSWSFHIEDLGTSWIFAVGILCTINGIGYTW